MSDSTPSTVSHSFLSVGLPLKLTIHTEQGKIQCASTLLGWKDNAWLVCEWPFHDQQDVKCKAGASCVVSYMHAGKWIGYRSEVRDSVLQPVPLLFLAFPKTVEEFHLRKHVRVPSNEPMLLMEVGGEGTGVKPGKDGLLGGLLQDVSQSGCSVLVAQLPKSLKAGALIKMEFGLPGIGHITNLSGVVKNLQEQGAAFLLGVEFRFNDMEFIEFRGWGGSVQQVLERCILQKQSGGEPALRSRQ